MSKLLLTACALGARASLLYVPELSAYPGYTGGLQSVSGSVSLIAALGSATRQVLVWDLQGLDPNCTPDAGAGIDNACGIHVHTGTSCAAAAGVGGHLYEGEQDPWADAVYVADSSGASAGSLTVPSGLSLADLNGRAVVVHELEGGGRIACGILYAAPGIDATDFSNYPKSDYPGYNGDDLDVRAVSVSAAPDGKQVLAWELSGLDSRCYPDGASENVSNSCGIHVHTGACTQSQADIGAHYYNTATNTEADPWAEVSYVTDSDGASVGHAQVDTGLSLPELMGKTVVWHDYDGVPHACAVLESCASTVVVQGGEAIQSLRMGLFELTGLPLTAENDWRPVYKSAEGQHLYYWKQYEDWRIGTDYQTEAAGLQSGPVSSKCPAADLEWFAWTGEAWSSEYGVSSGAPTALSVAAFDPYPGYSGPLATAGVVVITGDQTQTLIWDLAGLDPACSAGAGDGVTNGCGIHVHAGTSCEEAGGHFYDAGLDSDPWLDVVYVSDGNGFSAASATVATGLQLWELAGRAFVVHALASGARVACGKMMAGSSASVTAFSPYPGYAGSLSVEGTLTLLSSGETSQIVYWSLSGLDAACVPLAGYSVTNGCGLHVHTGLSCEDAAAIGGHFYNETAHPQADPWASAVYVANSSGVSTGVAYVETGLPLSDLVGRAFVAHELSGGGRIACAVVNTAAATDPAEPASASGLVSRAGPGLLGGGPSLRRLVFGSLLLSLAAVSDQQAP